MRELISRSEVFDLVRNADNLDEALEAIDNAPATIPQVYIDVTGGIADVIACDHRVAVSVLDYDIQNDEQDDYCIDGDGKQVWIYGDSVAPDPKRCAEILSWPTVAESRDRSCGQCEGSGRTQSMSNLEEEVCPVCDGEGTV